MLTFFKFVNVQIPSLAKAKNFGPLRFPLFEECRGPKTLDNKDDMQKVLNCVYSLLNQNFLLNKTQGPESMYIQLYYRLLKLYQQILARDGCKYALPFIVFMVSSNKQNEYKEMDIFSRQNICQRVHIKILHSIECAYV